MDCMTNQEYLQRVIKSSDRIYIDTATLMESEWMKLFLLNCKEILRNEDKKIIVHKAVCLELARLLETKEVRKVKDALAVIEILLQYQDIFEVQNDEMTEQEVYSAFADGQLLSELTINKREGRQLLITNDRKLSRDAFNLNDQESYKGYRILVCYLNKYGELNKCQCVKEQVFQGEQDEDDIRQTKDSIVVDVIENKREVAVENTVGEKREHTYSWKAVVLTVASFATGFIVDRVFQSRRG